MKDAKFSPSIRKQWDRAGMHLFNIETKWIIVWGLNALGNVQKIYTIAYVFAFRQILQRELLSLENVSEGTSKKKEHFQETMYK